ncbi:hypothetical protein RFI_03731, partial [Reticulomyxa filosa]
STQQQADFVGSLVTETNPDRPTEWIKQQNSFVCFVFFPKQICVYSYFLFLFTDDGYDNIAQLLKDTLNNNWQTYLANFKKDGFDDEILLLLISEDDLIEVLPNDVDRNIFFQYAMRWKQSKSLHVYYHCLKKDVFIILKIVKHKRYYCFQQYISQDDLLYVKFFSLKIMKKEKPHCYHIDAIFALLFDLICYIYIACYNSFSYFGISQNPDFLIILIIIFLNCII